MFPVIQSNTTGPALFKTDPLRLGILGGGIVISVCTGGGRGRTIRAHGQQR